MSWRTVVITGHAKLEEKLGFLYVRNPNETKKIHLSEISLLFVESTAVSLTASLLCELSKRKIKVIFCDEKRNPCFETTSYYGSHNTSLKLKQQIGWNEDFKKILWTAIISEKIKNQSLLLKRHNRSESEKLLKYISEIEIGDTTNREGHAAKVYFNALFGKEFSRQSENSVNAALNYGYSILLSAFNREIVSLGYTTKLGIFHDNMFNGYNLSCDLMEPFRPLVDERVLEMGIKEESSLAHNEKMDILSFLNMDVNIDGKKQLVSNAIKVYCKCITDALTENDISLLRFYGNEQF